MTYHTEYRRQVIKVTKWKDGCVYKTKVIGHVWVHEDICLAEDNHAQYNRIAKEHGGDMLGSMSTDTPINECIRTVKDL